MPTETSPPSPCIQLCTLDERGWCRGCYRTIEEITAWGSLEPTARWAVLAATARRRASDAASRNDAAD